MTIASKLETINEALGDIKSSIVAKGVTPSGNITTYSTAIESISTGDEITATNTTGSTVSVDDRVWVNGEDVYTQNFTIAGSPTIDSTTKVMSNLSYDNYIYFQNPYYSGYSTLEINSKFRYSASVGEFKIFEGDTYTFKITILGNENKISVYLATTIGAWDIIGKGSTTLVENTVYYVKLKYDGSAFQLLLSTDGTTWNTDYNNITDKVLRYGGGNGVIGMAYASNSSEIYLLETNVKKDGNVVWTPYTKTGTNYSIIPSADITSTSFTGVAQEAIANNATGSVKTLLDGNGTYAPTTATKSITTNGTYTASAENAYGLSEVTVNVPTPDTWYNWRTDVSSNFTTVGSLSFDETAQTATGFGSGNYIEKKAINSGITYPTSFEIGIKFTYNSSTSNQTLIAKTYVTIALQITTESKLSISLGSTGVDFNIASNVLGTSILEPGKTYSVKLSFNGSVYKVQIYDENVSSWTDDITINNSSSLGFNWNNGGIIFGNTLNSNSIVFLSETYYNINNDSYIWNASVSQSQCYTLEATPTTSTQVYEIPKKTSALTITAVGTGTITLSDSKVYNRNSAGDVESPVLGTKSIDTNGTYTAASDYLDGFSSVTVDVPSAPTKKYNLLDRVKDDNNNEIGTVSGFFTDANNVEYAVVCLDAVNRITNKKYLSSETVVPNIPQYQDQSVWSALETATKNTTEILATGTSTACTHCRSKSYTIDGNTYEGQLPNLPELVDIFRNRVKINASDPTAATSSSLVIPTLTNSWSSTQKNNSSGWTLTASGTVTVYLKTTGMFVIPVLEIPNT